MKAIAVIPARMASIRFPGKPLADILGLPMIEHVRRRVELSNALTEVVVATCDQEIAAVVQKFGGKVILTAASHERCTDRIAEASESLEADIIVNVQGDEPLVRPEMFEPLIAPLLNDAQILCTNLMSRITEENEYSDENVVKVVCDLNNDAVYFSREPIPSARKAESPDFKKYKQLGIVAFRKEFLLSFTKLSPTPLEIVESNDMLRVVEHGHKVRMVESQFQVIGVDTPADLERAKALFDSDPLYLDYL